jgi:hypothetical protein
MARKPPPIGRRFQPGQSGNPSGKAKLPDHIINFRKTTYEDFLTYLQRFGSFTKPEFEAECNRSDQTMFEGIFAKIILLAHEGDKFARQELLERLWGKVKEVHEIQDSSKLEDKIKALSPEKQEQLIELLREASLNESN